MKTFLKIDRALDAFFKYLGYGAGLVGAFMMLLSVVNVVTRQFFMAPIFGTVEIVSYCGLLMGAFAVAHNEISDGNITMTLFTDKMNPVTKNIVETVMSLLAALFYGAIAKRYFTEIGTALRKATATQTLAFPMWIIYTIMFIGFLFGTIALLLKAARALAYLIWRDKLVEAKNGGAAEK